MAQLIVNQKLVTEEAAKQLQALCPFGAFDFAQDILSISAACKMCRICIKNGPPGVVRLEEDSSPMTDKGAWQGIAVLAEWRGNGIAPVSLELIGKAKELAVQTRQPVYALLMGSGLAGAAHQLLGYGVDYVYVYDDKELTYFRVRPYAAVVVDFINRVHPSSMLIGATPIGRSLAPRVAARLGTGLTADCTRLEMREPSDLVQIRPAFGGNLMAQIITPNHRPQLCTVRYKVFDAPVQGKAMGEICSMAMPSEARSCKTEVLGFRPKAQENDLCDADMIVAVGRGVKSEKERKMIKYLADQLHAQLACTRPLVESGQFSPKQQIGLSGRTVKPKLLIAIGISGAVQFAAGMQGAECIIAINNDPAAPIFQIAHHGLVGDFTEIIPSLLSALQAGGERDTHA